MFADLAPCFGEVQHWLDFWRGLYPAEPGARAPTSPIRSMRTGTPDCAGSWRRGCTTWTMKVDGLNAVIIGSPNVNSGYILVNNKDYPTIATDYERTFRFLKAQPVDLFLGAHGGYYDMNAKHARSIDAGANNPFIDPEGYHRYVEDREKVFLVELAKQKAK